VTLGRARPPRWPWGLAALGGAAAVWPLLGLPAVFLGLLGVLGLPGRSELGARASRVLVGLAVLGAGVGLARFVVEIAMPGIVRGGRAAAEQRAVSWLRDVLFAEDAMRKAGWIDPDGDGIGSAALLGELCGLAPSRGQRTRDNPVLTCGELISTELGWVARRGGYLFAVCLPNRNGRWSAQPGPELDEEAAERQFVAYAWPDAGARFEHAFFLDQDENIRSRGVAQGAPLLTCDAARGPAARTDWVSWRGKRPRPGPLPGDRP
jgi:hypothetical protein